MPTAQEFNAQTSDIQQAAASLRNMFDVATTLGFDRQSTDVCQAEGKKKSIESSDEDMEFQTSDQPHIKVPVKDLNQVEEISTSEDVIALSSDFARSEIPINEERMLVTEEELSLIYEILDEKDEKRRKLREKQVEAMPESLEAGTIVCEQLVEDKIFKDDPRSDEVVSAEILMMLKFGSNANSTKYQNGLTNYTGPCPCFKPITDRYYERERQLAADRESLSRQTDYLEFSSGFRIKRPAILRRPSKQNSNRTHGNGELPVVKKMRLWNR